MSTINPCRACLEESFSDNSIFELNLLINENTVSFVECFFKCTNVKLIENEKNLPQTMCETCTQSIINMYQFQLMCEATDLQLKPKSSNKDDFWETEYLYNVPKLCKEPFFYQMDNLEVINTPKHEIVVEELSGSVEELSDSVEFPDSAEFPDSVEDVESNCPKEIKHKQAKGIEIERSIPKVRVKCNECGGRFYSKYFLI